ncbi:Transmembrane emp24 domain-containing protein 1 [Trichinella pseudospiralis]|uniref:Transmembrane emp24 domain-containing protein 1 n=2 Tax=Trichinella pseudospiralis TaxID=6337 RepID=A0A0V1K5H1_TRIPS|nr:Transmembrane emp24 domain-containing protein 1 [Trichinella pseudospiralis]
MMHHLLFCILLFPLSQLVCAREEAFAIVIPSSRLQCYFVPVESANHSKLIFDYQVIYGGDLDVNVLVLNPSGSMLMQDVRKSENSHDLDVTQKGDYQVCFDNTFSSYASKTVYFAVQLLNAEGISESEENFGLAASESYSSLTVAAETLRERLIRLRKQLDASEHFQSSRRVYETRDRMLMESKLSRVNFWSFINLVAMITVAGLQIYMVKSLFEDHSRVGQLLRRTF